ncbi:MAG: T9SS type A sorting domain-containing protein [Ignavibacteriaceae bacterium]|nr:T9SS type A sorting domain-containing protein [Ignavibacteriaceae bacterium]
MSGKVWNGMIPKLVAQRKDSLGNNLWQEPYVEIADSLHINTMLSIIQYRGYYLYGWMGRKNGDNEILQIQGIRHNGTLLFNEGSISLSDNPGGTTHIPIIPSDSGSCLFISNYTNTFVGTFGQKIDTLGLLKWNSNQVLLSYPELNYLNTTTDCAGGAIGVGYYNSDFGIRVFKVSSKGILGEIITVSESKSEEIVIGESFLFQNYPNPFNYSTIIKYQIPKEGQVRILLYNILGEKLKILSDEYQYVGTYTLTFYSNDLSSGIYLYTLETGLKVLTKKLTIIK